MLKQEYPWYLRGGWPYVIIATVCTLLYAATISYGFSPLDEYWLITKEKETLSSFENIPVIFTEATTLGMYYRPMLTLSLMIDTIAGAGNTTAFHVHNILLHAGCMLLLYYFLLQIRLSRSLAFFGVFIFAVHPINVHAVAWVPGRNDVILASFVLLSCIFLIGFLRDRKWYKAVLHFLFFFLCLLTKESAILLPFIYLLFWWFYAEKKTAIGMLPFVAVWIAADAGFYFIRSSIVHFMPVVNESGTGERIADLFSTFFVYAGKVVLPVQQSVMPVLQSTVVWPFIVVMIIVILLFMKFGVRNKKIAILGAVWFCILIAIPVWMGMANGTGECYEHRVYTPMIGMLLLFSQLNINLSMRVTKVFAMLVICVLAVKTIIRLPVYTDEYSYVLAGVNEAPGSSQFHDLLGIEYQERGKFAEALEEHNRAIELDSGNADYFSHRAKANNMLGNYRHALTDADRAIKMDRTLLHVFFYRSSAHFGLGEYEEAFNDLDTAKWFGVEIPEGYADSLNKKLRSKE